MLKLSDVYKREILVENEEPDPIKIRDFCENLRIQLVEAEMTPEAVDHLQKGMNIRSGESIRAFQLCFDQQKEDCFRRKKSVVFSEAELAKRFWQAVSRCSRYAAAAKSMENLLTMQVPGVAVPKEVRLVVEWCENQDMVAAADAIVSGRKLSGASGTDAVFVTTGGVVKPGRLPKEEWEALRRAKALKAQTDTKGKAFSSSSSGAPSGATGQHGKAEKPRFEQKPQEKKQFVCACGESHPGLRQGDCPTFRAIMDLGRKALGKSKVKWIDKKESSVLMTSISHCPQNWAHLQKWALKQIKIFIDNRVEC